MLISQFKLGYCDVHKVHKKESAHAAFRKLGELGSSAIAIVDDKDKILDVLSVTDLKLLG